jgi:hypothetical protein
MNKTIHFHLYTLSKCLERTVKTPTYPQPNNKNPTKTVMLKKITNRIDLVNKV